MSRLDAEHVVRGPRWTCIALGCSLLLLGGSGSRWLTYTLGAAPAGAGLPPGLLAALPLELAPWRGTDVALDLRVRAATDTDDLLHRRYVHTRGGDAVALYIAYGTRPRDLLPHRPEVCYPGAGWTVQDQRTLSLPLASGAPLRCSALELSRGGLDAMRLLVLSYYVVDDEESPNVDLLRSRLRGIRYMLQIQFVAPVTPLSDAATAERSAAALAARFAPALREQLARARATAPESVRD